MSRKAKKIVWIVLLSAVSVLFFTVTLFAVNSVPAVQNAKIRNTASGLEISWSPVSGADSYEVYKVTSGSSTKLATVKTNRYTDTAISYNNGYRYKIRAVDGKIKSSFVYVSYKRLAAPSVKSVSLSGTSVKIQWNAVSGATGYILYKKAAGSNDWTKLASVSGKTLSYTDKQPGSRTVSYAVKQQSGNYESALGSAKSVNVTASQPAAPKNLRVRNSPKGVTLSWSKVSSGAKIEIMRKVGDTWTKAATVKASKTSYIDTKAVYGKKNSYVIRVLSSSGQKSKNSSTASLYAVDPNKKMVALTYDDGPYRPVTTSILDTLKKNGARATFFVVGSRLSTYSDCLKLEAQQGCEIGCHTYNHTTLTKASDATIKSELSKTNDLIKQYSGQTVRLVRAPGGSVNDHVKAVVPYPLINWSVDTRDWSNRSSSVTYSNFKKSVRDGSIVLMHDLYPSTAEATKSIVSYLKQNGYQIVTVSEMMDAKGINITKGHLYTSAY